MKHESFETQENEPVTLAEPAALSVARLAWSLAQRVLAVAAMVLLLPLLAVLYPVVRLTSRGPFLYSQMRPGRGGKPFRAYKIRTMHVGADRDAKAARSVRSGDPMVTPVGRLLRDLKIDELPQLYNVAKGEMDLVGPRPIAASLQQELEEAIPGFAARLLVKPGVTSLPQVCVLESGDQSQVVADWTRRFEMERHYIANRSVGYDLLVIALTFAFVIRKALKAVTGLPAALARRAGILPVLLAALVVSGCTSSQGTSTHAAAIGIPAGADARQDAQAVAISPLKATPAAVEKVEQDYRIGAGDVLKVNIFGETGMNDLSIRVNGDGRIQLPAIAPQKVAGL
nr:sugar transferase [Nitratireductor sp.]